MKFLKSKDEISDFIANEDTKIGCLADTSFLYALAYEDDRLYNRAIEVSDILAEKKIPIYTNVISRMEFVDLIFRKQISLGAIQLLSELSPNSVSKSLYNLLKNIRDQHTAHRKIQSSYKISEGRLKNLREEIESASSKMKWREFCDTYAGIKLFNEWQILEEELGLNFVEILDGQSSPLFKNELLWSDMVQVMSKQGIRAPDAMIINLFTKSKFPLLITGDRDFETCFSDPLLEQSGQAILFL